MPAVNIQLAARKYDLPAECWQVFEQQPVKIRFTGWGGCARVSAVCSAVWIGADTEVRLSASDGHILSG